MFHLQTLDAKPYQLLQELMGNPDLQKAGFLLCGGGALALHLGHRQSTDIDLFTPRTITPDSMKKFMEQTFGSRVEVYSQSDLGVRGFLDGIKFDLIRFPYQMKHPPVTQENIRLLDLRDAVAMKVHAVANRGLRRDFYDLAEILQKMPLKEVLANYRQQFSPSSNALAHTVRALTFFADAEVDSTKVDVRNGRSWDQVKKIMVNAVRFPMQIPSLNAPLKPMPHNPHAGERPTAPVRASAVGKPTKTRPTESATEICKAAGPSTTNRVR